MHVERHTERYSAGAYDWSARYYIFDRDRARTVGEVTINGYDPGRTGHGFTCPNKDEVETFLKSGIQPISDPRLPDPIVWSEVIPSPFPINFDLQAQLVSKQDLAAKISDEVYHSRLNPVTDEGNLSIYNDTLTIINPRVGIRANIQQALDSKGWHDFQYLRYEKEEIIFFGQAIPSSIHSKDVAIFRYDRNAKPIAVYRIHLPDLDFRGDVRYIVDHLSILKDRIELTLLDVAKDQYGRIGNVLSKYELQAPITNSAVSN